MQYRPRLDACTGALAVQIQEFRTGATRQAMETTKSKEDCKDLRQDVTDLRDKINDLDNRVRRLPSFLGLGLLQRRDLYISRVTKSRITM